MPRGQRHRRISWKVRRCADGWLPVVLIGEEPWTALCQPTKRAAVAIAKQKVKQMGTIQK